MQDKKLTGTLTLSSQKYLDSSSYSEPPNIPQTTYGLLEGSY